MGVNVDRVCLIGLDRPEIEKLEKRVARRVIGCESLPRLMLRDGRLFVEAPHDLRFVPVSRVVFHGIFDVERDLEALGGLALWNGPCLPNPTAMLACRLKVPCLAKAIRVSQYGFPEKRGYVSRSALYPADVPSVAKWGNWHCGDNKALFDKSWTGDEPAVIEPFVRGGAVRVVAIGDRSWQIALEGDGWLKSIHHPTARFMPIDERLRADTLRLREAFGLEVIANDYIVGDDGEPWLLEVNHIPNVTRFPEIWDAYESFVAAWCDA